MRELHGHCYFQQYQFFSFKAASTFEASGVWWPCHTPRGLGLVPALNKAKQRCPKQVSLYRFLWWILAEYDWESREMCPSGRRRWSNLDFRLGVTGHSCDRIFLVKGHPWAHYSKRWLAVVTEGVGVAFQGCDRNQCRPNCLCLGFCLTYTATSLCSHPSTEFHNSIHLFFSLLTRKDRGVTVLAISTSYWDCV